MVNAYLEPSLGLGTIRPYYGGGVGLARFRARGVNAFGLPIVVPQASLGPVTGSKTGFAYQAMAGLSGPVSDHVTASFGYRYFGTPSGADRRQRAGPRTAHARHRSGVALRLLTQ